MSSSQLFAIVGVVTGIAGAVVAWLQLHRTPRLPRSAELVDVKSSIISRRSPPIGTALRPPTGRLPAHVCGRENIIAQLAMLARKPDGRAHLLTGLGGCGKTTVALAIADRALRRRVPVWWVSAVERASLTSQFLQLARLLGAAAGEVDEALAGQRNPADLLWRFLERRPGWFIVIDNADDPDALTLDQHPVGDGTGWVRPTRAGLILLTSRTGDPMIWGRHIEIHTVGWLNDADGGSVLLSLAPHAGSRQDACALSSRTALK
jgi:AAA ATPase domain